MPRSNFADKSPMLPMSQMISIGAWLSLSALVTLLSLTQVHADHDCQKLDNPRKDIQSLNEQLHEVLEQGQLLPSSCDALDAADKVYDFLNTRLVRGDPMDMPELGAIWLDCDWVLKTLAAGSPPPLLNLPEFENRDQWWRDQIALCQRYPAPPGYQISKVYIGIDGVQVALYTGKKTGKPPILAFAGTQDLTDVIANTSWGKLQMLEFLRLKASVPPGEPWYLKREQSGPEDDLLIQKFRMKTFDESESLAHELAQLIAQGKDIVITGHSLGGALAQASAYLIQSRARDISKNSAKAPHGQVHVYTWNGLGATKGLKDLVKKIDPSIVESLRIRNFTVNGDVVPTLASQLGGESVEIPNEETPAWIAPLNYNPTKFHSVDTIHRLYSKYHCPKLYAKKKR